MTKFLGEIQFRVTGCANEDDFEGHVDEVMDYLLNDERVSEADYTASLTRCLVEFSLVVDAADDDDAYGVLSTSLRAAIHAAEGATVGWEPRFRKIQTLLREADLIEA